MNKSRQLFVHEIIIICVHAVIYFLTVHAVYIASIYLRIDVCLLTIALIKYPFC